jgi:hypothetical protein
MCLVWNELTDKVDATIVVQDMLRVITMFQCIAPCRPRAERLEQFWIFLLVPSLLFIQNESLPFGSLALGKLGSFNQFSYSHMSWWHVLSQGYGQSMAFTSARPKYQSPTDFPIPCEGKNKTIYMKQCLIYTIHIKHSWLLVVYSYLVLNSRRAICIPSAVVLRLAVSEAWVYEEPIGLGTGETLNGRHHLAPESYSRIGIDRDMPHPNSDHRFDQHMQMWYDVCQC